MYFQILDDKRRCGSVYYEGALFDKVDHQKMTHTWSYSPHLDSRTVELASVWCSGQSLDAVCPEELKEEWALINKRAKAFLNSFKISKINLSDVCLFDLLPEGFLLEFYGLKNKITEFVFENYEKPKNYDFMCDLTALISTIKSQSLNIKFENLDFADEKVRSNIGKIKNVLPHVSYSPWTTATGRLATHPNSFPILNLNKELRSAILPQNDVFVELDYNAAELRVLFALLGQPQPEEDVHQWISENIFNSKLDRDETKKKVFAWLYNPKARNKKLNSYLDRDKILEKFYHNGTVETLYDRNISVEQDKAVNYTIQSTASDLFLTSAIKVDKMLKNKKSRIAFCIHDSLVLDMCREEKHVLEGLIEEFSKTKFGVFKTNVSMGRHFGAMRKIR